MISDVISFSRERREERGESGRFPAWRYLEDLGDRKDPDLVWQEDSEAARDDVDVEGAANDNSEKDLLEENFSRSDFVRAEIPLDLHMFILENDELG